MAGDYPYYGDDTAGPQLRDADLDEVIHYFVYTADEQADYYLGAA